MSTYVVRTKERDCEDKAQTIVGIFWADNTQELWGLVDEHVSPTVCEYSRLKSGGILLAAQTAVIDDEFETVVADIEGITEVMSEDFDHKIYNGKGVIWKDFDGLYDHMGVVEG